MRETILMIGIEQYDKEIMTKVFTDRYDMVFIEKTDLPSLSRTNPFFKLVIYNLGIPDDKNLRALQVVKERDPLERPIIVITSQNTVEVDRFLASTGVFYHLVRPFEMRDLEDLIKGALRFWQKKLIDAPVSVQPGRP